MLDLSVSSRIGSSTKSPTSEKITNLISDIEVSKKAARTVRASGD